MFFKWILSFTKRYKEKDKRLIAAIQSIVGNKPFNLYPYKLATQHSSIAKETRKGVKESNERLEYLGDAVLGLVVADYLFKKFPFKDEGFMTEVRSRIVNRESLNDLARKIGVSKLVEYESSRKVIFSHKSIHGDMLEAFIGAIYIDKGFNPCKKFILNKLILPHFDFDSIQKTNPNFKSKIIEWAQRENNEIRFDIEEKNSGSMYREFTAKVYINDAHVGSGMGYSKKKAEQDAAQKACETLKI
ncbi:MAG: ribonuclease III [Bacteroidota bacterium]|nr:ribonuclease III [Bacteroidota bacterium]